MTRIALVAGESSGDALGAGLIRAIREKQPDADFMGVAGPGMADAGCEVLADIDRLSVMGLAEIVSHLPGLLRFRRRLAEQLIQIRPDCVVGIDAPDFNLGLEARLKAGGLRVAHYVSPSVWAWRPGRVRKVARSCDRVLCLFPFEPEYYRGSGVDAVYVGHPLADAIPSEVDRGAVRRALGLTRKGPLVALLPGSRGAEIRRLGAPMAGAARLLANRIPSASFVIPLASPEHRTLLQDLINRRELSGSAQLVQGRAHEALAAADVAISASGTATLEAMLFGCPQVVAYRVAPLTHFVLRRLGLLRIRNYALPNILAGRSLVPELMQGEVTAEALAAAAIAWLEDDARVAGYRNACRELHGQLRRGADRQAASAVLALMKRSPRG